MATPMRTIRRQRNLTLRDLAYFTGASASTLSRLERNKVDSSPALKARIARALSIPIDALWPNPDREAST